MWAVIRFKDGVWRVRPFNGDNRFYSDKVYGDGYVLAVCFLKIDAQSLAAQKNYQGA